MPGIFDENGNEITNTGDGILSGSETVTGTVDSNGIIIDDTGDTGGILNPDGTTVSGTVETDNGVVSTSNSSDAIFPGGEGVSGRVEETAEFFRTSTFEELVEIITSLSVSDDQSSSGNTVYLETEIEDVKYRIAALVAAYPDFGVSISGAPSASSVYVDQVNFTITGSVSSGSLTEFTSISTNLAAGTIVNNAATFTGSDYEAVGNYTATVSATGLSGAPEPVIQSKSASKGWSRFVPMYIVVASSTPTALPTASSGTTYGGFTAIGAESLNIYLITTQSGSGFFNQGFPVNGSLQSTITGQEDQAGTSRDFKVYLMGQMGATGTATLTR